MTMVNILNNKVLLAIAVIFSVLIFLGVGYKMFLTQASFSGILRATVSINPLILDIVSPSEVSAGENFKLEALLKNKGNIIIENVEAIIFLPPEISSRQKDSKNLGNLPPQKEKKATWVLKGEKKGEYIISVSAKGVSKDSGDLVKVEESVKINIGETGFLMGGILPQLKKIIDFLMFLW